MSLFVALVLLGIFVLLMIGAVVAVSSTLGKRHAHAGGGGNGRKPRSRRH